MVCVVGGVLVVVSVVKSVKVVVAPFMCTHGTFCVGLGAVVMRAECVHDPVVGDGVVIDKQNASQKSSAEPAFRAVKLVVVWFVVGVARLLLCSWWPLCVLSAALEGSAHWRRSTAADALIVAAEFVDFERIAEDRYAVPMCWRIAASFSFARTAKADKIEKSTDGPKIGGPSPPISKKMVENAKEKNGVSLA